MDARLERFLNGTALSFYVYPLTFMRRLPAGL